MQIAASEESSPWEESPNVRLEPSVTWGHREESRELLRTQCLRAAGIAVPCGDAKAQHIAHEAGRSGLTQLSPSLCPALELQPFVPLLSSSPLFEGTHSMRLDGSSQNPSGLDTSSPHSLAVGHRHGTWAWTTSCPSPGYPPDHTGCKLAKVSFLQAEWPVPGVMLGDHSAGTGIWF